MDSKWGLAILTAGVFILLTVFGLKIFANNQKITPKQTCTISGCSSEICADEEVLTTCILLPEAVCYETATCTRQTDGECGWTQTEELTTCLENYR